MTLRVVRQAQTPPSREEFVRGVILWYRNKRMAKWPTGNGHLGVTQEELEIPLSRQFGDSHQAITRTLDGMLKRGELVLVVLKRVRREEQYSRGSKLKVKILQALPKAIQGG
jgi:hypothetical protein